VIGERERDIAERELSSVPIERTPPRSAEPQRNHVVSESNWDNWNDWARFHVQIGLDHLAEVIGAEVAKIENGLNKKISELESELGPCG